MNDETSENAKNPAASAYEAPTILGVEQLGGKLAVVSSDPVDTVW
jgi:hypothetical protein